MLSITPKNCFTVKDVPAQDFIKAYADFLKKNDKIKLPAWIDFVKTGKSKDLAPEDPNWLYTRIASIARKVYLRAHIGVGTLKHMYGQNQRFGVRRRHHVQGAGKIIRYSLQRLEDLGVVSKDKKSLEKKWSRVITAQGQKELDIIANNIGKDIYKQK